MSLSRDDATSQTALDSTASDASLPVGSHSAQGPKSLGTWRTLLATLLCLVNANVSALLLLQHHGEDRAVAAVQKVCGQAAQSGCETVARSPYAKVAGVPLAAIGLFFYASLALVSLLALVGGSSTRGAVGALTLVALLSALAVDAVLLGIQALSLHAFCRLCLLTYVVSAAALAAILPARLHLKALGQAFRNREGRLVLAGWLAATASLVGAVVALELGLRARERERNATLLGPSVREDSGEAQPSLSRTVTDPAPADLRRAQEEARAALAEARRLQEILDDPQRLDLYFADKAAREYEQGPVHTLELEGVPIKGPAQAPIRVVAYSDFLCPFCRGIAGAFANYLPTSGGRVAVYFKNYPLDEECNPNVKPGAHPGACALAMGGLCAQEQGRFWPYHDRVFATSLQKPQMKDVVKLATDAGLESGRFESCLREARTRERLSAEIAEARKVGVEGTPTLFINGKRLPRINDFTGTVDKEAARLGLPPLPRSRS